MYTLHYVRGISLLDTPYFLTKEAQEAFFNNHAVMSIDYEFPPHYTDTLKLEDDETQFLQEINYLSLEHQGKTYYYFITSQGYNSQGVFSISIMLDVIQTYMFDIVFNNAVVNRRLINRWNDDGTINRNYLRDNLSNGRLVTEYYEPVEGLDITSFACFLIKAVQKLHAEEDIEADGWGFRHRIPDSSEGYYSDGCIYYLVPCTLLDGYLSYWKDTPDSEQAYQFPLFNELFRNISPVDGTAIVDIKLVNGRFFESLVQLPRESIGSDYYFTTSSTSQFKRVTIQGYNVLLLIDPLIKNIYQDSEVYSFTKNRDYEAPFNYHFIPQLLDENYMSFIFGERLGYTGVPLHELETPKVRLNFEIDMTNYHRCYSILAEGKTDDIYLTNIINTTQEFAPLFNNAWATYQSQHYGDLTRGISLAKQNAVYRGGRGVAEAYGDSVRSTLGMFTGVPLPTGGTMPTGNITSFTPSSGFIGALQGGLKAVEKQTFALADMGMELYNIDQQLAITRENYEYTPDTMKQGNTFIADYLSKSLQIIKKLQVVNDIEVVAKKLEAYGYSVREYYNNQNLFEVLNTRLFYNIIKVEEMNISLKVLGSYSLIKNIISRFTSGLRLWNVQSLNEDMYIGDVCHYDNVEIAYIGEEE